MALTWPPGGEDATCVRALRVGHISPARVPGIVYVSPFHNGRQLAMGCHGK